MTRKYILTGGPGSGKSSILLELELRGEHTVREAAEDVIKRAQADGDSKPWEKPDFQERILGLQVQRERAIPAVLERAFIDRGILDGLAYAKPASETYKRIQQAAGRYDGVFLIENLGQTQTNGVRRENHIDALELEYKLKEIYLHAGYKIWHIPADPVADRADLILRVIDGGLKLR